MIARHFSLLGKMISNSKSFTSIEFFSSSIPLALGHNAHWFNKGVDCESTLAGKTRLQENKNHNKMTNIFDKTNDKQIRIARQINNRNKKGLAQRIAIAEQKTNNNHKRKER